MEYISVTQASEKWGLGVRRIRALCSAGRIDGAVKQGWSWMIPSNLGKPSDGRKFRHVKNVYIRIGSHNFNNLDKKKLALQSKAELSNTKIHNTYIKIIRSALYFEGITLSLYNIERIINLEDADNIDFLIRLKVLNIAYTVKSLVYNTEKRICSHYMKELHSSLVRSTSLDDNSEISDEDILVGGAWEQDQRVYSKVVQIKSFFVQYENTFTNYNTITRSALIFSEIMRIEPFKTNNSSLAYLLLLSVLIRGEYLPVVFDVDTYDQLKAALAMTVKRGNYSQLIDFIIEHEMNLHDFYLGVNDEEYTT